MQRSIPIALLAVALVGSVTGAQADTATIAKSLPGRRALAWINAVNSGSDSAVRAFLKANLSAEAFAEGPVEERLARYRGFHDKLSPIVVERQVEVSERAIKLDVRTRGEVRQVFSMSLEPEPPFAIGEYGFEKTSSADRGAAGATTTSSQPLATPVAGLGKGAKSGVAALPATIRTLAGTVRAMIDSVARADSFSGTVLIAKDGRPVLREAVGFASQRYKVPMRADTKLNLASAGKMFTAVAVMQLVEQGKVSLDQPIIAYLPDYANAAVAQRVTIRQLLTHTAGLGQYWNAAFDAQRLHVRSVSAILSLFVNDSLRFTPGERFFYSNAGFVVLGAIIERVGGVSYYDYVRHHVFDAAGMVNSAYFEVEDPVPNLAVGYTTDGPGGKPSAGRRKENTFIDVRGGPAGGCYSTVDDLLSFANALREHKLLGAAWTDSLLTGRVQAGPTMMYAFGFGVGTVNGHKRYGHNGGSEGVNAEFRVYPDFGYTVVVLSNYDPPSAARLTAKIEALLVGSA